MIASDHFVQFFDTDSQLVDAVSRFVHVGIESAEVCVVIATADHRERIATSLNARGVNIAVLESAYQYIAVDAQLLLGEFFDGRLDRYRFHDRAGLLLRQAAASGKPVRVFDEMVAILASRGLLSATLELEELCNELGRSQDVVLFCGYLHSAFTGPRAAETVQRLCTLHLHSLMAKGEPQQAVPSFTSA